MDRKMLFALLVAAMVLAATATPLNQLIPTSHQTQPVLATRNPAAPPPQTAWDKTYGGTSDDAARSVQQTSDSGYIVAGTTWSFGAGSEDLWLVKTDSSGNQEWNKVHGGSSWEWAYSVRQTSDGGYIAAGATNRSVSRRLDFWLVKTVGSGTGQEIQLIIIVGVIAMAAVVVVLVAVVLMKRRISPSAGIN